MEAREEWSCPRCGRVEEGQARICPRCGVPLVSRTIQPQPIAPASAWVRDAPSSAPAQPSPPNYPDTRRLDMPWQTSPPGAAAAPPGQRSVPTAQDTSAWARNSAPQNQAPNRPYVSPDAGSWVKGGPVDPAALQQTQIALLPSAQPGAVQGATTGRSGGGRKIWYGAGFGFVGSIIASIILGVVNVQSPEWNLTTVAIIVGVVTGAFVPALLSAYPPLLAGAPMRALRNGALAALLGAVIMTITALVLTRVASRNDVFFIGSIAKGLLIWVAFGVALGVIDGIVARSPQRLLLGGLGGALGGAIAFFLGRTLQNEGTFVVVGLLIGLGSGLIQEVAKQAWITVVGGPNVNVQAIVDKAVLRLGSSEDADIDFGLYRDGAVAPRHFEIRRQAGEYVLAVLPNAGPLTVNGEPVQRERRLNGGDRIQIGGTILQFNTRAG